MKRPLGISFIGYFYIFGAIVLLLTLGVEQEININVRVGLSFLPELAVRLFTSLFSLLMAYGYLRLQKWGYRLMMIYSVYISIVSLTAAFADQNQVFIGNLIFSLIVISYTFGQRSSFYSIKTHSNS